MKKIDRTGEIGFNVDGLRMRIIEYIDNKNITVLFGDGNVRKTSYLRFKRGEVYPTFRNKKAIKETPIAEVEEEKYAGSAMVVALSFGIVITGIGIVGGIVYCIMELVKAVF